MEETFLGMGLDYCLLIISNNLGPFQVIILLRINSFESRLLSKPSVFTEITSPWLDFLFNGYFSYLMATCKVDGGKSQMSKTEND